MKTPRFYQLLATYGADFSRWSAQERAEARILAERDVGCREAVADAARLDALLAEDAAEVFEPGEEAATAARLRHHVMLAIKPRSVPHRPARAPSRWRDLFGPYGLAGACAGTAALALGIWLGWTQAIPAGSPATDLLIALQTAPVIGGLL